MEIKVALKFFRGVYRWYFICWFNDP